MSLKKGIIKKKAPLFREGLKLYQGMELFYEDLVISSVFYLAVCFPIEGAYRFYLYAVVDICVGYMVECDDRSSFGRIFRPYIVENDFSLFSNTHGEPFVAENSTLLK